MSKLLVSLALICMAATFVNATASVFKEHGFVNSLTKQPVNGSLEEIFDEYYHGPPQDSYNKPVPHHGHEKPHYNSPSPDPVKCPVYVAPIPHTTSYFCYSDFQITGWGAWEGCGGINTDQDGNRRLRSTQAIATRSCSDKPYDRSDPIVDQRGYKPATTTTSTTTTTTTTTSTSTTTTTTTSTTTTSTVPGYKYPRPQAGEATLDLVHGNHGHQGENIYGSGEEPDHCPAPVAEKRKPLKDLVHSNYNNYNCTHHGVHFWFSEEETGWSQCNNKTQWRSSTAVQETHCRHPETPNCPAGCNDVKDPCDPNKCENPPSYCSNPCKDTFKHDGKHYSHKLYCAPKGVMDSDFAYACKSPKSRPWAFKRFNHLYTPGDIIHVNEQYKDVNKLWSKIWYDVDEVAAAAKAWGKKVGTRWTGKWTGTWTGK